MALSESIYEDKFVTIAIRLNVVRHEDIGKGVFRAFCNVNGSECKRVHQPNLYPNPVWSVNDRIVSNWFSELLETAYQDQVKGQTIIFYKTPSV